MDIILVGLLGFIFALILHELTHLLVITYYKIPFKAIIITKWSAFGFLVDNEAYLGSNKILTLLHFSPLIWCFVILLNPGNFFLLMFPLVNIFGGVGDIYYYFRLLPLTNEERIEWAKKSDDSILKTIIWKKDF
ncbi:metalloprotease family protein [Thermoplasmatota archaeon]